jgi:hypothetical protein
LISKNKTKMGRGENLGGDVGSKESKVASLHPTLVLKTEKSRGCGNALLHLQHPITIRTIILQNAIAVWNRASI